MAIVQFYCEDYPDLKVGPGTLSDGRQLTFVRGWLFLDTEDPDYAEKLSWVEATREPKIENLGGNEELRASTSEPRSFACPVCDKRFSAEIAKRGHMRTHAPAPTPA